MVGLRVELLVIIWRAESNKMKFLKNAAKHVYVKLKIENKIAFLKSVIALTILFFVTLNMRLTSFVAARIVKLLNLKDPDIYMFYTRALTKERNRMYTSRGSQDIGSVDSCKKHFDLTNPHNNMFTSSFKRTPAPHINHDAPIPTQKNKDFQEVIAENRGADQQDLAQDHIVDLAQDHIVDTWMDIEGFFADQQSPAQDHADSLKCCVDIGKLSEEDFSKYINEMDSKLKEIESFKEGPGKTTGLMVQDGRLEIIIQDMPKQEDIVDKKPAKSKRSAKPKRRIAKKPAKKASAVKKKATSKKKTTAKRKRV